VRYQILAVIPAWALRMLTFLRATTATRNVMESPAAYTLAAGAIVSRMG
jgi:hypothetical protein